MMNHWLNNFLASDSSYDTGRLNDILRRESYLKNQASSLLSHSVLYHQISSYHQSTTCTAITPLIDDINRFSNTFMRCETSTKYNFNPIIDQTVLTYPFLTVFTLLDQSITSKYLVYLDTSYYIYSLWTIF